MFPAASFSSPPVTYAVHVGRVGLRSTYPHVVFASDRLIENDFELFAKVSLAAFERDRLLSCHQTLATIGFDLFRQMIG